MDSTTTDNRLIAACEFREFEIRDGKVRGRYLAPQGATLGVETPSARIEINLAPTDSYSTI